MLPTYNEAENIVALVRELRSLGCEVLVVDDNSPDGTAQLVRELAKSDWGVHLLVRTEDRGRGRAGRDGFVKAMELGADCIVEMDADFSHRPQDIPALVAALADADIAVGSRLVAGGSDGERGFLRRWLTLASTGLARSLLGVRIRDVNSGFRAYRRSALEAIEPSSLRAAGPEIVAEVLARSREKHLRLAEVPIVFARRKAGTSKLTLGKLLKVLWFIIWGRKHGQSSGD